MENTLQNTLKQLTALYTAYTEKQVSYNELVYKLHNDKTLYNLHKLIQYIVKLN